ncbi:MAG: hypothetical protein LBJ86_00310, partial [Spirochaetaceae bacterium]|nr:hypothetical protein [Spirochaetaceae bacterium]
MPTKMQLPQAKSFEEIWIIIQETNEWRKEVVKQMKESSAEVDRQIKEVAERQKETDRQLKESGAEVDRRFKEVAAEADRRFKESAAEADRRFKESAAEADRRFKEVAERFQETEKLIKETSRQLGDVHNRVGELVEHIIVPNILKKVEPLNFKFKHVRKRFTFTDKNFKVIAEADILLINGEYVMIIEVKTVLKVKDVDDHLKRLERIRREAFPSDEGRRFIGCVAGAVVDEAVKKYAHKKGFYVLEQSGDTLK